MSRLDRLKERLKEIPNRPGVYLHKNVDGDVIYVGKARNLRSRVGSYLVGKGVRDPKTGSLVAEIEGIDCEQTDQRAEGSLSWTNTPRNHPRASTHRHRDA